MAWLHISEKLGWKYKREEDVDRKYVNEVRQIAAERLTSIRNPAFDDEICGLRKPDCK